jgi:hypothetical protein
MSNINATNINSNYPTPGVNNSSQGFRDNFTSIKNNLTTAKSELDDLQIKVLVKSALSGTTMDNDMANGVIKNAQTIAFRGSTKNLGDNLTGVLAIDCSIADVHIGKLNGDVILDFQKWAPAGTRGTVEVIFTVTAGQKIEITDAVQYGVSTIKGYVVPSSGNPYIVVPAGVTRVHYVFSSLDCGTTIEINQTDDSRIATRIKTGVPLGNLSTDKVTVTNGSTIVKFATLVTLKKGALLFTENKLKIGEIAQDVTDGTSASLNVASSLATGEYLYYATDTKGRKGDQYGDVMTNGDYIYICKKDYDGTSEIWGITGGSSSSSGISGSGLTATAVESIIASYLPTFTGNIKANIANITTANITGELGIDISKVKITGGAGTPGYALVMASSTPGLSWVSLNTKVDSGTYSTFVSATNTALADKVDTSVLTAYQSTVTTSLSSKVDTSAFTTYQTTVTNNLANKVSTSAIGNIASINRDGNASNVLLGSGVFGPVTFSTTANVSANVVTANTANIGNLNFTGTGPIQFVSQSTVVLTPATGANVVAGGNLKIDGNSIFATPGTVTNGTTSGTAGQIIIDILNNKIWVCYGGTNWKSATLV